MYKKHKIKKKKDMGFADPKFFNVLNIFKIYERCLKIMINEAMQNKASIHEPMGGKPVIKDIWRIKDSSIKTEIMAYEPDSAKVLPRMRNKRNADVHKKIICAKTNPAISLFLPFF
ncbi:MAG: hypothetical protein K8S18_20250 [Desulfobacula sp.]|nr:hypothetical protein [Desulfobacula sp.]